jgi:hypothetical protein
MLIVSPMLMADVGINFLRYFQCLMDRDTEIRRNESQNRRPTSFSIYTKGYGVHPKGID